MMLVLFFFFFQAEDGIRDYKVTGVQTCALPICHRIHRLVFLFDSDVQRRSSVRYFAHSYLTPPETSPSDTPAARAARAPGRSPCPPPPPRSTGNSPVPPIPGPRRAPDS